MEMRRKIASIAIALFAMLSLSAMAFVGLNSKAEYNFFKELYNPPRSLNSYMVRQDINIFIHSRMDDADQYQRILDFYTEYTKNPEITKAIIKYSLEYRMPINLAFALSYVESGGFKIRAIQHNNNGTIDRGLFQLNNGHRKDWEVADFYNIDRNCEEGIRFWAEECQTEERPIPMTFIAYNSGPYSERVKRGVVPEDRIRYVDNILSYEDELNIAFNNMFGGFNARR